MNNEEKALLKGLFNNKCIKFGEFKLKSGIMSPVYVDLRGIIGNPDLLNRLGSVIGDYMGENIEDCDRIAAIPYAGIPIGVATSLYIPIPLIYPRKEAKEHGTKKTIEGPFVVGENVLVIDDVITDGASKIEAIEPLKEAGLDVTDILVVLDREQGGAKIMEKAGYKLHSIFKLTEVVDELAKNQKITSEMAQNVKTFLSENQFV